jgi:hypothetical protein
LLLLLCALIGLAHGNHICLCLLLLRCRLSLLCHFRHCTEKVDVPAVVSPLYPDRNALPTLGRWLTVGYCLLLRCLLLLENHALSILDAVIVSSEILRLSKLRR